MIIKYNNDGVIKTLDKISYATVDGKCLCCYQRSPAWAPTNFGQPQKYKLIRIALYKITGIYAMEKTIENMEALGV